MRLNKINVVFLHKISCTQQFENKFSLRSFALSLRHIGLMKGNIFLFCVTFSLFFIPFS